MLVAGGIIDVPAAAVARADGALAFLPPLARLFAWGVACGAAAMGLYALLSPQRRLAELSRQAREARSAVRSYDGEFSGALPLLRRQIALSLRHTGLTLPPTLAAALPVVLVAIGLAARFAGAQVLVGAPRWLGGWEAPFFGGALLASLALKLALRIH